MSLADGPPRVEVGTKLLVEAEHGCQKPGGPFTLLVTVERFDRDGIFVRVYCDDRGERLVAPFRVLDPRG